MRVLLYALALSSPHPPPAPPTPGARVVFVDDFEGGIGRWIARGDGVALIHHDAGQGRVLRLRPSGDVHALIRGSERWGPVAIEGDVLFPTPGDAYLGVMYNYRVRGARSDFGLIYIKNGRSAYLQPNPHRDYNVTRTFYPEFVAPLEGAEAIQAGTWQRFRAEIVDGIAHFYVGNVDTPQLIFPIREPGRGMLGLQPRSVGGDVLVDNVRVTEIADFSHRAEQSSMGPVSPMLAWSVYGPSTTTDDDVARSPSRFGSKWRAFALDARGGVETSRVVDYHGSSGVAYFRTIVRADKAGAATLLVSSVDDLALWVNGRFAWFIPRGDAAWFDAEANPKHAPTRIPVTLVAGDNVVVLRVRGGAYAGGGFFAWISQDGKLLRSP